MKNKIEDEKPVSTPCTRKMNLIKKSVDLESEINPYALFFIGLNLVRIWPQDDTTLPYWLGALQECLTWASIHTSPMGLLCLFNSDLLLA